MNNALKRRKFCPAIFSLFYYPNQRRVDVVDGIKARYVESFILGDLAKDASVQPRGLSK